MYAVKKEHIYEAFQIPVGLNEDTTSNVYRWCQQWVRSSKPSSCNFFACERLPGNPRYFYGIELKPKKNLRKKYRVVTYLNEGDFIIRYNRNLICSTNGHFFSNNDSLREFVSSGAVYDPSFVRLDYLTQTQAGKKYSDRFEDDIIPFCFKSDIFQANGRKNYETNYYFPFDDIVEHVLEPYADEEWVTYSNSEADVGDKVEESPVSNFGELQNIIDDVFGGKDKVAQDCPFCGAPFAMAIHANGSVSENCRHKSGCFIQGHVGSIYGRIQSLLDEWNARTNNTNDAKENN
ncbi:MAG TPA: hypothetical protein PLA71_00080 [Saccharofermentans sp.]|nr:hypothetical protein [Saccharofermentans sp.]